MRPTASEHGGEPAPRHRPPVNARPDHARFHLGLKTKSTLAALLLLVGTLAIAGAGAIYSMRAQSRLEHRHSAEAAARGLALAAQVAMFSGDKAEMDRLAARVLEDPRVAFVTLHDGARRLAWRVRDERAWADYLASGLAPLHEGAVHHTLEGSGVTIAAAAVPVLGTEEAEAGLLDISPLDPAAEEGEPPASAFAEAAAPAHAGHTVVALSSPVLDQTIRKRTLTLAALFGLVALCVVPPVWIVVGRWTDRLSRVVEASRCIAAGDLSHSLEDDDNDEVAQLAAAFEHMRQSLSQRDAEMRALNDSLQARVAEQTHDLREQEAALERALGLAKAASQAKNNFLANMSHEIRTPMTAILGYADLLGEGDQSEDERRNCVQTIRRSGQHLMAILNDILDLSKIEAGRYEVRIERCDLIRVLADVTSLMRPRAGAAGLSLGVEFAGPIPRHIRTDAQRLRQILMNLVGNSVKFTERGGIRLVCAVEGGGEEEGMLFIRVIDTGPGIPAEQLDRLFKPFTQADESMTRRHGGTGLGLVISRRLAELLGGTVTVESQPGRGSTFTVSVQSGPVDPANILRNPSAALLSQAGEIEAVPAAHSTLRGRILLVEDGPDNQRLIGFHLRKAGAAVEVADNGRVALEAAAAAEHDGQPYDLVLMDMQMPVMDGYTATRELRRRGFVRPIIALTAHAMTGDADRCLAAGCDAYASKPIDRTTLIETCACWIERGRTAHPLRQAA